MDGEAATLLHRLRLRGVLGGIDVPAGPAAALEAAGLAHRRGDRLVLSPAGRVEAERRARLVEPAAAEVTALLGTFDELDRALKHLCTAAQSGTLPAPVAASRLEGIDGRAGPLLVRLRRAAPRFGGYRPRLDAAAARVRDGDLTWLTSPRCDSYHTVWMELHEDLLLALGRSR